MRETCPSTVNTPTKAVRELEHILFILYILYLFSFTQELCSYILRLIEHILHTNIKDSRHTAIPFIAY